METVSRSYPRWQAIDMVHCALFATLMMIGANITSFAPFLVFGGVPITLQTFFAVLAGLMLGSRKGAAACAVYMLIGLAGAPVFARFSGGASSLVSPTFGFIVSFIFAAWAAGKIIERRRSVIAFVIAALVATAINYLFGTNWMYAAYMLWAGAPDGFSYELAWIWMLPPLPKDIALAVLAGFFAHRMQRVLKLLPTIQTKG
ncbi:biotin transporter BioY [Bhargavaea cecembensis]|uniref:biotin transporter BioY n=1 Tax=Bhargavaea cecembensis TaxID=394098 RepID=UPI000590935F|nr:biotin transporter BioY [Bhargavaea cecembensis]